MSDSLSHATLDSVINNLPATAAQIGNMFVKHTQEEMSEVAGDALTFTPRLQLMTANSSECKAGTFPVNNFAIVSGVANNKTLVDLGKAVDVFIVTWRPMALNTGDNPICCFNPQDQDFKDIKANSGSKDLATKMENMYGPQYLLWVPATQQFATLFMGSVSARIASAGLTARIGKAAKLSPVFIETKTWSWWGIKIEDCDTELEMPIMEDLLVVVEKFNNPPVKEKAEKAPVAEGIER